MQEVIAGTYEILKKLGAGGGGTVYLANHIRLGKQVVLKADKRSITTNPSLLRREVDILKELNHPNIPRVYDFFAEGEIVYTVMDYIEGESLEKPLKREEIFSQAQVIAWAKELLDALAYLHSPTHGEPPRGYVHSDIKPANLMRTPDNHIVLIDFNIALALGEAHAIGCSIGYASPEHYGLDFSVDDETATLSADSERTVTLSSMTPSPGSCSRKKEILPDARSDIYSTGATLYHLLSGKRPSRNAKEVEKLSKEKFSPMLVDTISRAMEPNPDRRYQTAEEMLFDLTHLRERDPRSKGLKRKRIAGGILFPVCISASLFTAFVGLKRMQTYESWQKLAGYAEDALQKGDTEQAISCALQAFPQKTNLFLPESPAESQKALTAALGVYDLSDGYKNTGTIMADTEPLAIVLSPAEDTVSVLCAGSVEIFDVKSGEKQAVLPALNSALATLIYLDNDTLLYAGDSGITAYSITGNKILWTGAPATFIATSEDATRAAAVYKDETIARIYDLRQGTEINTVDFGDKKLSVTVNDIFVNPNDNILVLNKDGSLLAGSFSDGSVQLFSLENPDDCMELLASDSGYTHFEGGFSDKYFAFSASSQAHSVFAVIDTERMEQTGGFQSDSAFSVKTDADGIYVQTENYLVKLDPETGEQQPLVSTAKSILNYAVTPEHTLIATSDGFDFYDKNALLISEFSSDNSSDYLQLCGSTTLVGSMNSSAIRLLEYESHEEAEVLSYPVEYAHDEARVNPDGERMMLFSYQQFRIYDTDGTLVKETDIPDSDKVYDQQYRREDGKAYLEVIYNDGKVRTYDGPSGELLSETQEEAPASDLYETFETDSYLVKSPLHGNVELCNRDSGKTIKELTEDAYLTYVTQIRENLILQFITTDGKKYGLLLDSDGETIAELPDLCDVLDDTLFFDYPTGNVRQTHIYNIKELVETARNKNV